MQDLDLDPYRLPPGTTGRLFSPSLLVYLDRVRENVRRVIELVGRDPGRWRPHVKTTKIPEVWRELLAAGVRHFKCATVREVRVLAATLEGPGDVLLAHPARGPALAALGELAERFPEVRFSILSEDPAHVAEVPAGVSVFVDVDPGFHRTGVPLSAGERIVEVIEAAGARFGGISWYEGHLDAIDLEARRRRAFEGYEALGGLLEELRAREVEVPELVTSGTPGFRCALEYEPFAGIEGTVHRVSPGTVVFHDLRSEEQNPGLGLKPAALVFSRVVSSPGPESVTCDAGSKSIAAEAGAPCAAVLGAPHLEAGVPSEEHLPFRVRGGQPPAPGSELYLVPRHVCPTVNLAEEAVLVDGGEVRSVVPVAARAHDVGWRV